MTFIKCPKCGLTNQAMDTDCQHCKFVFRPETSAAIQKPRQSLPEFSFADLAEPDDFDILPSHSRTPQMIKKSAAKYPVKESPIYSQKKISERNLPQFKAADFYPTVAKFEQSVVKKEANSALKQSLEDSQKQTKSSRKLFWGIIISGVLVFLFVVILVGLELFFNRSLFV